MRALVCASARRLGLLLARVATGLSCAGVPDVFVAVQRQSFERDDAKLLHMEGTLAAWQPSATPQKAPAQAAVVGGHGRRFINTYDAKLAEAATGHLVWGPLPWSGRRFGALIGAGLDGSKTYVVVEALETGGAWVELGRLPASARGSVLYPQIIDLGDKHIGAQVRVRVADDAAGPWGFILADALTFID